MTSSNTGFTCTLDEFRMWPVYDEGFLLSVLFGQTRNFLLIKLNRLINLATIISLFEMKEMTGTTLADTNSASIATMSSILLIKLLIS